MRWLLSECPAVRSARPGPYKGRRGVTWGDALESWEEVP